MLSVKLAVFAALLIAPGLVRAEDMAPAALNSFSSVPAAVASAQIVDQNGHILGKVERVATDQDGKPTAVSLRANSGRLVVVPASEVSYDGRILITSSDQPQIAALTQPATRTAAR